jgi:Family of unknown function (DUF5317)
VYILIVLIAGLVVALARGGRLSALADLQPRHLWLFFVPLALQLVAFSPLGESPEFGENLVRVVYLASMAIAALALVLNRHLPGLIWVAVGMTLNFLVIALNGGLMPVSAAARQFAGMPALNGPSMNVTAMSPQTLLPWLGDILPLPEWMPLSNVFSLGDVLVAVGGVIFLQRTLLPAGANTVESQH